MTALLILIKISMRQCALRPWCWGPVLLLGISFALALQRGLLDWSGFYRSPLVALVSIMLPVFACAGALADEVTSGRVLLLHSMKTPRYVLVSAKIIGVATFCWLAWLGPHLLLALHLARGAGTLSLTPGLLIPVYLLFHTLYFCSLLVFISVFVKSWGNSAIVFAGVFLVAIFLDAFERSLGELSPLLPDFLKTVALGPMRFVAKVSVGTIPAPAEVLLVGFLTLFFWLVAVLSYSRKQIGLWASQP